MKTMKMTTRKMTTKLNLVVIANPSRRL